MPKSVLFKTALYSLVFLNIFFLTAVVFSQVILRGESVAVPDITGKTVAQARTELAKKDLSVAKTAEEFNDRWDKGLIIRQEPAADSRVRVTEAVRVVTSAGSQSVHVPNLLNKSLDAALTLLQSGGLYKGRLSQVHTARYPAGRIIAQEPGPNTVAERNAQVGLLLSQGDLEDRYVMPDLIGRNADRVMAWLKSIGFKVADVRYRYYPGRSAGFVLGQYPPAGFRVQKRNLITLEVSR
jgi:beta-lactam-binding protein with PASTA domain